MGKRVLLGNEAIAWGLLLGGCEVLASYPGTPSSEVLPAFVGFLKETGAPAVAEWSINEMVAFQVALGASYAGKRSAVVMKQVGLNVAADALTSAAYTGCKGGFLIISADDPGPHSSQTEQDTRLFGMFAKVPVLDPATPGEALAYARFGLELSEKYGVPVILRPSLRVCHSRQDVELPVVGFEGRPAAFVKDVERWAATPKFRFRLHRELNGKLRDLAADLSGDSRVMAEDAGGGKRGIIAGGVLRGIVKDFAAARGIELPVLHVGLPFPLPVERVAAFAARFDRVLVLEETTSVIEMQLPDKTRIDGRLNGVVPEEGELDGTRVEQILSRFLGLEARSIALDIPEDFHREMRRPTLCPGCPHRNSFYAIRKAFPKGIYCSDIGCYTLGINLKAVDTVLVMGASIGLAMGLRQAYGRDGLEQPIVSTIGDSTFFHSGLPQLVNAVYNDIRILVVILDNAVTAMTGMQPAVTTGVRADGSRGVALSIEEAVRGCGVRFIRQADPYDIPATLEALKAAHAHTLAPDGGPAVVVARHPCVINDRKGAIPKVVTVRVDSQKCRRCLHCVRNFECPAISADADRNISINPITCARCGRCIEICPHGAFVAE